MKIEKRVPEVRRRAYRWVLLSIGIGAAWSLLLAYLAATFFKLLPTTPGRPVVRGLVECPYSGFVILGGVEHWTLSSTSSMEVVIPASRSFDVEFEDRAAWMQMPPNDAPVGTSVTTRAFGWPFRCLVRDGVLVSPSATGIVATPAAMGSTTPNRVYLPGLLVNTFSYAVPLFVVGWGGPAIGRYRRRRRGACEQCGYSLVGNASGVCPECGRGGDLV